MIRAEVLIGHNLKRRIEALERQHTLGSLGSTPSSSDSTASATQKEERPTIEAVTQKQDAAIAGKERPISPRTKTLDLRQPENGSMRNVCGTTAMEPEWMCPYNHVMDASSFSASLSTSDILTSQSPELSTNTILDQENQAQSLLSSSLMDLSSLNDYVQQNNTTEYISESTCTGDIEISYQRARSPKKVSLSLIPC